MTFPQLKGLSRTFPITNMNIVISVIEKLQSREIQPAGNYNFFPSHLTETDKAKWKNLAGSNTFFLFIDFCISPMIPLQLFPSRFKI